MPKFKHPFATTLLAEPLCMTPHSRIQAIMQMMSMDDVDMEVAKYSNIASAAAERLSRTTHINVTTEFVNNKLEENTLAFHFIDGPVFADYDPWGWYFSTKQFRDDLIAAEANDNIIGHFIWANSGGGEAWFLEQAYNVGINLTKPVHAFVEKRAASAGYYLISFADKIIAATPNDTFGSIGTMVSFWDMVPYYESLGFKWHEEYSNLSDLKNKKFNDLLQGKADQYKKEELDPLAEQFRTAVRNAREPLAKLDEKHPAFRGETFSTLRAIEIGLIDAQMTLEDAVAELYRVALDQADTISTVTNALSLIS